MSIKNLSVTAASNNAAPPFGAPEGATLLKDLNDIARQTLAEIRTLAASDTIASATTCDLGTKDATFLTVSGTTTITGLGTVSAGIYKAVTFSGALTLTHNATSLILPGAANIVTVAGDTALLLSLGTGYWKCMFYQRASVAPGVMDGLTASVEELNYVDGVTSAIQTQLDAKVEPVAGTWTPSLNFGGNAVGMTTDGLQGSYVKIGAMVFLNGWIRLTAKGSSTGDARVAGLPFTHGGYYQVGSLQLAGGTTFVGYPQISANGTFLPLRQTSEAGVWTQMTDANFSNTSQIIFSIAYSI